MAAARALLQGRPDRRDADEALAAFGVDAAAAAMPGGDEGGAEIALWSEHADAVRLFAAMLHQWRVGPAGVVGLDYAALATVRDALGLRGRAWRAAFDALALMEDEALRWFAEQRA